VAGIFDGGENPVSIANQGESRANRQARQIDEGAKTIADGARWRSRHLPQVAQVVGQISSLRFGQAAGGWRIIDFD